MSGNTAAFEQTVRSTISLAENFSTADWDLPTECPGWTVRDQVSHIVGVEQLMLGEPEAPHELPADLPHVRNDFGRIMEVAVDARRDVPGERILAELRATLDRRMAALPTIDPEQPMMAPDGRMGPYSRMMMFRAFDAWVHEQDIRRAVGRPGNLDAPAADRARQIIGTGLGVVVAKRAKANPGDSVTFKVTGPPDFRSSVVVDADGRGGPADDPPSPTLTLGMTWENYLRLTTGRCTTPTGLDIAVEGDPALATRILANMSVTP